MDKFKIEQNKLKQKRKYKPDDIRKKIKSRFHKSLRNIINENLKKAGSKHFFFFAPNFHQFHFQGEELPNFEFKL